MDSPITPSPHQQKLRNPRATQFFCDIIKCDSPLIIQSSVAEDGVTEVEGQVEVVAGGEVVLRGGE